MLGTRLASVFLAVFLARVAQPAPSAAAAEAAEAVFPAGLAAHAAGQPRDAGA